MKMLREKLTAALKSAGADLVCFAPAERFRDPAVLQLFPEAKTVIGIACRILRGTRRGIEDGTTYYQYTTGIETLEEVVLPGVLLRGCNVLEEAGFEALPQRRTPLVLHEEDSTSFEVDYAEVYRGKTAETLLDFERCAVDAGLGELGDSGTLLTDEFGPNQRIAFLLTDAEFPADPVKTPHLCDHCGECSKACPGHALKAGGTRDAWQCAAYYKGASRRKNPFMPETAFAGDPDRLKIIAGEADLSMERAKEIMDQIRFYPPGKHAMVSSMCGRMCDTACYVHLETKGVLSKKFRTPFRKRPVWQLPLEDEEKK